MEMTFTFKIYHYQSLVPILLPVKDSGWHYNAEFLFYVNNIYSNECNGDR